MHPRGIHIKFNQKVVNNLIIPNRFYSSSKGSSGSRRPAAVRRHLQPSPLKSKEALTVASTATANINTNNSNIDGTAAVPYQIDGANYQKVVSLGREESPTLDRASPASILLKNSALLVSRQLELLNIVLGWEQANQYVLKNPKGEAVGYLLEDKGILSTISRQLLHTRRPFNALVTDLQGNAVLKISRPVQLFLNSSIKVERGDGVEIGRVDSDWHLLRRRYNLFVGSEKRMRIDEATLSWDFNATSADDGQNLGLINRNWSGFVTEIFTDKGQYVVHFDATPNQKRSLSLEERAVLLACAITIDIDYFSRHSSSHHSSGLMGPVILGEGGGGSDESAPARTTPPPPSPPNGGLGGDVGGLGGMGDMGGSGFPSNPAPSPPPQSPQGQKNEWGDDPFLSDEEAGISSEEPDDSSSFLSDLWGAITGNDD